MATMGIGVTLAERGYLPDPVVRLGIRRLLRGRIRSLEKETFEEREGVLGELIAAMDGSPIALGTDSGNRQHYEVPAAFFQLVLGRRMKYSCGFWPAGTADLDAAEAAMLDRTCEHADLEDGMALLDLGCGWGSLSLWVAERYPACRVHAVSSSEGQRAFIDEQVRARGLPNVTVECADINSFDPGRRFDRVVSIEMFEHLRNYREVLGRISGWLDPEGRLLIHLFCHRRWPYTFELGDGEDWMARHYFSAGLMPCDDLLYRFTDALEIERHWSFSGEHYERTCEAWLRHLSRNREEILALFRETYGPGAERLWYGRWRLFFTACSELFALHRGQEWWVSHYRLRPRQG